MYVCIYVIVVVYKIVSPIPCQCRALDCIPFDSLAELLRFTAFANKNNNKYNISKIFILICACVYA